jgi:hypothetical protein
MKYTFYCAGRLELMAYKKSFLIGESIPFMVDSATCYCKIIGIDKNNITIEISDKVVSKILNDKLEQGRGATPKK